MKYKVLQVNKYEKSYFSLFYLNKMIDLSSKLLPVVVNLSVVQICQQVLTYLCHTLECTISGGYMKKDEIDDGRLPFVPGRNHGKFHI